MRDFAAAAQRAAGTIAIALGLLAAALATALWPVTAALGAVVATIVLLSWRSPLAALALALALVGFEGSVKILLGLDPTPLPGGRRAAGAAALDLALFAAIVGVVVADRLRTPRALWSRASRAERLVLTGFAAWLLVSVAQIVQGGDVVRGLEGFRLFQAYTAVGLAAAVAFSRRDVVERGPAVVLALGGAVAAYAALRVVTGPTDTERQFALSVVTTTHYGDAVRAIGSFSSAVGLVSFLTPLAVFALVVAYLQPRLRIAGLVVGALGLVGIVGSYGRGPVVAVACGLLFAVLALALAADVPRRRKLVALGLVGAALVGTYGAVQAASQVNSQLRDRAEGILDPFGDESIRMRLENWEETLDEVADHPLGRGIGTVGAASAPERARLVTTDNSFLKVLVEQGIPVAALFCAAMLGLVAVIAARLRRAVRSRRVVGLAALSGLVAFLALAASGEYVEQPGKTVAWAFLGIALAQALAPPPPVTEPSREATVR